MRRAGGDRPLATGDVEKRATARLLLALALKFLE
jgi:hypothetical protein